MKKFTLFILILIFAGCNQPIQKEKHSKTDTVNKTSSKNRKISDDSLKYYFYRIEETSKLHKTNNFTTIDEFPKEWITLSGCAEGLIVYHRGHKVNSKTINNDTMYWNGMQERIKWEISQFKNLGNERYYFRLGNDTINSAFCDLELKIYDNDTLFSVCKMTIYKYENEKRNVLMINEELCIPKEKAYLFKHLNEPNTNNPDSWINLKEVNVEQIKERNNPAFTRILSHDN